MRRRYAGRTRAAAGGGGVAAAARAGVPVARLRAGDDVGAVLSATPSQECAACVTGWRYRAVGRSWAGTGRSSSGRRVSPASVFLGILATAPALVAAMGRTQAARRWCCRLGGARHRRGGGICPWEPDHRFYPIDLGRGGRGRPGLAEHDDPDRRRPVPADRRPRQLLRVPAWRAVGLAAVAGAPPAAGVAAASRSTRSRSTVRDGRRVRAARSSWRWRAHAGGLRPAGAAAAADGRTQVLVVGSWPWSAP